MASRSLLLLCAAAALAVLLLAGHVHATVLECPDKAHQRAEAQATNPHPVKAAKHHRHSSSSPAVDAAAPSVPNKCPGIPYDFSTSNYCSAQVLDSANYKRPSKPSLFLHSIQLITRHGDRVPVNIAPFYDVAYNLCDSTQSTGYYSHPPPSSAEASVGEGVHGGRHARNNVGAPANEEGRRLEQIPLLYPQGETNPFIDQLWQGSCATGQLTTVGVNQHVIAGKGLRGVYVDQMGLLPQSYSRANNSFYLRSTDIWRTKQSAEALLSGLWPTKSLDDDVVPFHSFPVEVETMFSNSARCPALGKLQAAQLVSQAWKDHLNKPDVWEVLDRTMGIGHMSAWHNSFDHVMDNLRTRQCHGLPPPCNPANPKDCVPQSVADFVFAQGSWEYAYTYNGSPLADEIALMGISGFMAVLRDTLVAHVTGDASKSTIGAPKFAYFSGHDSTLGAVLGALNVTGMAWPPYASQMIFELWQDHSVPPQPSGFYVRVLYNAQVLKLFAADCCDDLCPATQLIKYLDSIVPTNVPAMCNKGDKPKFRSSL